MNLGATMEQEAFGASITRFADTRYSQALTDNEAWHHLAQLGAFALPFPQVLGGLGGSAADLAAMMEAIGYNLLPDPLLEDVILGGLALVHCGTPRQLSAWLPPIMGGEALLTMAAGRPDCSLRRTGDGRWTLSGGADFVPGSEAAGAIIIVAQEEDGSRRPLILQGDSRGLARRSYRVIDGRNACALTFDDVEIGEDNLLCAAGSTIDDALHDTARAACAEMIGVMRKLFEATLTHATQRRQFGVPISSFQVVQHRLSRLQVLLDQGRSILARAIVARDGGERQWQRAAAAAMAFFCEASVRLGHDSIQLHGGMGVVDEFIIARGHKRLVMLSRMLGGAAEWRRDYADRWAAEVRAR